MKRVSKHTCSSDRENRGSAVLEFFVTVAGGKQRRRPGHDSETIENPNIGFLRGRSRVYSETWNRFSVTDVDSAELKDLTLRLQSAGIITGQVINGRGQPVVNATLRLMIYRFEPGYTNARG